MDYAQEPGVAEVAFGANYLASRLENGPDFSLEYRPMKWVCTKCWAIRPRAEGERLPVKDGTHAESADGRCSSCGAVGKFASDSSHEWGQCENEILFDQFTANVQKAGYDVEWYSQQCDHGDHEHCSGKSRASMPNLCPASFLPFDRRHFERCLCNCHSAVESPGLERRKRSDDDTVS